jgi:geranylgeranyl pyrophosphate synthase
VSSAATFIQVKSAIQQAVESAPLSAFFRRDLHLPLRQPGKALADHPQPLWPALVLASCSATGGAASAGVLVAAAVEIFMAGLDVLDEIEDADHSPTVEAVGAAKALNVATALLLLGQNTLFALPSVGIAQDRLSDFVQTLVETGLGATDGQHHDLATAEALPITTDEDLAIARAKSGRLVGGACRLGAMVGTTDTALLDLYTEWGRHYGTAAQLANDLHDAGDHCGKSDARQHKGTLPLLYARGGPERAAPADSGKLESSGALHFTWVILEIERQNCLQIIERLAGRDQVIADLHTLLGCVG